MTSKSLVSSGPADTERRIALIQSRALHQNPATGEPPPEQLLEQHRDVQAQLFRMSEELRSTRMGMEEQGARAADLETLLDRVTGEKLALVARIAALETQLQLALQKVLVLQSEDRAMRAYAEQLQSMMQGMLASASWRLLRPLRQVVERLRGRRWQEPTVPLPPPSLEGQEPPLEDKQA